MKLLKLESGSRSGPNTGERNSVSRARCKRQSKDLMQWMEETSTAVENHRKNTGRIDQFGSAKLPFNTRGMALLLPRPAKRQSGKQGRYRVAAAAAVTSHALGMVCRTANFEVDLRISLDPPRFSVKRSISPAIHVTTISLG